MTPQELTELRKRLIVIIKRLDKSFNDVSKDIGIYSQTLIQFVNAKQVPELRTIWKIQDFLEREEAKIAMH